MLMVLVDQIDQQSYEQWSLSMSVQTIRDFSDKARADSDLGAKLKACEKLRDLIKLAREEGFDVVEDLFYPPNEPQFVEDQLSEKMANAILRC